MLRLVDLVKLTHGSIESKAKLIDDFHESFPECTKNSIERRIKEFFVKDRRGDDPKLRYYASEDILAIESVALAFPEGSNNPELLKLASKRIQPLLNEIQPIKRENEEKKRVENERQEREKA